MTKDDNDPLLQPPSDTILLQSINNTTQDLDYFPSVTTNSNSHFIQRIKQRWTKRNIILFLYNWRWSLFFFGISVIIGIVMFIYRRNFFEALEALSHHLSDLGYRGYLLMSLLIFLSAFPPIIGYSTYQTLSGYTYGFQIGFPISYFSALIGAIICFSLCRLFIKTRISRLLSRYPNFEAVVKAVEKKGFKLFLLIRISPYPFNLLNFFFASTSIPLSHFVAGTAISLLKIALHVYIGANLTSFVDHLLGKDGDLTEAQLRAMKVKYVAFIIFTLLAIVVMAYLYQIAKTAVAAESIDDEEQVSFLNHRQEEEEDDDVNASTVTILSSGTVISSSSIIPLNSHHERTIRDNNSSSSISLDAWDAWEDEESAMVKKRDIGKDD
ncbi:snare associated Golgi protein-domain-containing protein [Cokeromyces recurvatus]|uniref:snare associated Golgi protein-domain-containing protein n=1 Tax=Cokeromyces recurvatus TaxID=90255 RepID=UPI00221FF11A|nr:snare associated Golgi protein-domain-containing protein [Cokeromyces recurvatus]KAI7897888.1 snare associated Golgi protein-domain-containing protein [Cokeromyces recurvatus]